MRARRSSSRRSGAKAAAAASVLPLALSLLPVSHPGPRTTQVTQTITVATGSFDGCPDAGSAGDPQLNSEKNRSDAAVGATPITVQYLKSLPTVAASKGKFRSRWPLQNQTQVRDLERHGVVLSTYIVKAKGEGPESCNCGSHNPSDHDVHVYVNDDPDDTAVGDAAIVEVTPRWRAANPTWTWQNLDQVGQSGQQVRITGWLLYDQEHWNMLNAKPPQRGTLWEIHPITSIQVETTHGWIDLATYEAAAMRGRT